jgi:flagellar protein FliO/FliZ
MRRVLSAAGGALLLAAPAPGWAQAAAPAAVEGPSLLPMLLALVFVLALIPLAMWGLKRLNPSQGQGAAGLRVVAQLSLGPRERVVVLEAGDRWLLLGVTGASINRLGTLPKGEAPVTTHPAFARLLDAARGRSNAP